MRDLWWHRALPKVWFLHLSLPAVRAAEETVKTNALIPVAMLEAQDTEHRLELAKTQMQLVLYRQALEEHGIQPPDKTGEELLEMWRDCRTVISTASEFVGRLGSAKELLA